MRRMNAIIILSCVIGFAACQPDEEDPDLQEIARDFCMIMQMCDPFNAWESQEACEEYSANEFAKAETDDRACFDARLTMETCIGSFETCDEYEKYDQGQIQTCQEEFGDFYHACRLP